MGELHAAVLMFLRRQGSKVIHTLQTRKTSREARAQHTYLFCSTRVEYQGEYSGKEGGGQRQQG